MNFLKGNGRRNFGGVVAVIFFAALILVWPHPAHADGVVSTIFGWLFGSATALADVAANFVGWLAYLVSYLISSIAAIFIALEAYVVNVILQLNGNVVNTLAVQAGFQVTLSVANLGFVLGIIVIAIMTILRRETYGVKSLLWKLVLAAILVNFSLVISGAIINFANQLTLAFMGNLPGAGGGVQTANTWSGLSIPFADNLAGAFAPHRLGLSGFLDTTSGLIEKGSASNFGSALAKIITAVFSVVFVVFMLIAIIIVLLVFILMLLIRYVYLTILLILMPIAWLFWIFPKLSHHWDKWWSQFFRWTFFAPIVIFFLYLALATASLMSNAQSQGNIAGLEAGIAGLGYQPSTNNKALAAVSGVLGGFANTLIGTFLQMFVLIGLAVGGMIAADKMSVKGASAAVGAVKGVGNAAKNYVGRQTKKGARAIYEKERFGGRFSGQRLTQRLQTSRIPGLSAIGRQVATLTERGGKNLVEAAGKEASGKDSNRLATELQGLSGLTNKDKQLAYLQELQKRGDLGMVTNIGGKSLADFLKEDEKTIKEGYQQPKLYKDLQEGSLLTESVRDAQVKLTEEEQKLKAGTGSAAAVDAAKQDLANMMIDLLKVVKNPAAAAEYMKSDTEIADAVAKGKPLPFGMTEEAYRSMRDAVTAGVGKSFTAAAFSTFIGKMERFDQLDGYVDRIQAAVAAFRATGVTPTRNDFFNPGLVNWIQNSPGAQNAGLDFTRMGL